MRRFSTTEIAARDAQISRRVARTALAGGTLAVMAKMSFSEPVRVKLKSPADMAAAIPYLVGFQPEESLVVAALHGENKQVGLTMRFDLPPPALDADIAQQIAVRLVHARAQYALVACCTSAPDEDGARPRQAMIDAIESALHVRGIPLRDALLIRDGLWWSYLCDDEHCCPPDGSEIADGTSIAAANALMGRAPLPTRAALAEQLKPVAFVARRAMEQALEAADAKIVDHFMEHGYQRPYDKPIALLRSLIARFADPRTAALDDKEAACLIAGTKHVPTRDLMIAAALDHDLDAVQTLFLQVARRAFPPHDAPACTLLAAFAYADGNGALANVALDRALASDPEYSLALLLRDALYSQVPPSVMRRAWKDAESALVHKPSPTKSAKKRKKAPPQT
jgi:hypothetical protein